MTLTNKIHQASDAGKDRNLPKNVTAEQLPLNPANEDVLSETELEKVAGGLNPQPIPPGQKLPKGNLA